MLPEQTVRQRARLAWVVMLTSFFICLFLTISVPILGNRFIQTATEPLDVQVQANQGTIRIDNLSGRDGAVIAGGPGQLIERGASVFTGSRETAVWIASPPSDPETRLLRLQVFSNTVVRLNRANAPRFSVSNSPYSFEMTLESGRVRLTLPELERPLSLVAHTPQSDVLIDAPGQYTIIITNEATEVTVDEGTAVIRALVAENRHETMTLVDNQRARVTTGAGPIGREGTDRNLIQNGSFQFGQKSWTFFSWNVNDENQPPGFTITDAPNGEPRLHVFREGIGHADVRIRQLVQQDVTELDALQLSMIFRINSQSLGVCGVVGSECPLFVRINYVDEQGVPQVWQQGFFAFGEPANDTPDSCPNCGGIQTPHQRVPLAQDYFYEVDFPTQLALQGALPPRFIDSVELVMSGHSFDVELYNISLLAVE